MERGEEAVAEVKVALALGMAYPSDHLVQKRSIFNGCYESVTDRQTARKDRRTGRRMVGRIDGWTDPHIAMQAGS